MIQKLFHNLMLVHPADPIVIPKITDYKFARSVAFLPISVEEIVEAQKYYPIFFLKDSEGIVPFVAMGVQEDKNLFIGEDGNFKDDYYIPAIFRVYPFSVTKIDNRFSLVVDMQSLHDYPGSKKLFTKAGNLTKEGKRIINMVETVYTDLYKTKQFLSILNENNLLRSVDITINTSKSTYVFEGMLIIDEEKVKKLNDIIISKFYKNGILDIIVLHMASLSNINRLGRMAINE